MHSFPLTHAPMLSQLLFDEDPGEGVQEPLALYCATTIPALKRLSFSPPDQVAHDHRSYLEGHVGIEELAFKGPGYRSKVTSGLCELMDSLTWDKSKDGVDFLPALNVIWLEMNAYSSCTPEAMAISQAIRRLLHNRPGLRIELFLTSPLPAHMVSYVKDLCQDLGTRCKITSGQKMVPMWPEAWNSPFFDLYVENPLIASMH